MPKTHKWASAPTTDCKSGIGGGLRGIEGDRRGSEGGRRGILTMDCSLRPPPAVCFGAPTS
eukprot:1194904-Prorocentrum_minimum.AAC.1